MSNKLFDVELVTADSSTGKIATSALLIAKFQRSLPIHLANLYLAGQQTSSANTNVPFPLDELLNGNDIDTMAQSEDEQWKFESIVCCCEIYSTPLLTFADLIKRYDNPDPLIFQHQDTQLRNLIISLLARWAKWCFVHWKTLLKNQDVKDVLMYLVLNHRTSDTKDLWTYILCERPDFTYPTADTKVQELVAPKSVAEKLKSFSLKKKPIPIDLYACTSLEQVDSKTIAQQLTLFADRVKRSLSIIDVVHYRLPQEPVRIHTAIHIWVCTTILQCQTLTSRIQMLEKFIDVLKYLLDMNNLQDSQAVYLALHSSNLHRLRYTWEGVSKKHREVYEDCSSLLDMSANHRNIRQRQHECVNSNDPFVPGYYITMTDIVFISDGNPTYVNVPQSVNVRKLMLLWRAARSYMYQSKPYPYYLIPKVQELIQTVLTRQQLTERELFDISLQLEPRGADKKSIK
jgi:hypothetical protein